MAKYDWWTDVSLNKNQLLQARLEVLAVAPTSPGNGQVYFSSADNNFYGWNGTSWINLSQIIDNAVTIKGEISNANTNPAFPSSPITGDTWFVTTTAGTVGGLTVEIGDQLVRGSSGWFVIQANLQAASTTIAGFIRLATQSEANAGSLSTVAIAPSTLAGYLTNFLYQRKSTTLITSLAANTPTTVTHGLNVANQDDVTVQCYQSNAQIGLSVKSSSVNAILVESNQALGNVKVVVTG